MTIDLLPTLAKLIGAKLPERKIDGADIGELIFGDGDAERAAKRKRCYFFYWNKELHAIREGRWKLHFPHPYRSLEQAAARGRRENMSRNKPSRHSTIWRRTSAKTTTSPRITRTSCFN